MARTTSQRGWTKGKIQEVPELQCQVWQFTGSRDERGSNEEISGEESSSGSDLLAEAGESGRD